MLDCHQHRASPFTAKVQYWHGAALLLLAVWDLYAPSPPFQPEPVRGQRHAPKRRESPFDFADVPVISGGAPQDVQLGSMHLYHLKAAVSF
jgi:hypothetical protein